MNKFTTPQRLIFGLVLLLFVYQTVNYIGSRQTVIKFLPVLSKFQSDYIKKPIDSKKEVASDTSNKSDSSQ